MFNAMISEMRDPRKRAVAGVAVLAASLALAGCGAGEAPAPREPAVIQLSDIEFAGPPRSGEANLHGTHDGALLTWLEPAQDGVWRLRLSSRGEAGWSDPVTVRESDRFFVNWADFPSSVRMSGGEIAVHWLEKTADATYAYHVMLAISADGGRSWSEPFRAHDDESPTEHGFVSMVPWEDGVAMTWLDGRAMSGGHDAGEGGAMSARYRTLLPEGRLGAEVILDARTCECCQTTLAVAGEGLVAAYRDRSETEVRDIAVVRGLGETWSEPRHVGDDNWTIPGCPVNGPQLSARGDHVAIAWYTGAGDTPVVQVAFSNDGGESFGEPTRLDDGLPVGRVDLEHIDDEMVLVTWLEASGDAPRVRARIVRADGDLGTAVTVAETSGERSSGFPRMARVGDELVVAYTLPGADGGLRVRAIDVEPLR